MAHINDNSILDLFWAKDEAALVETKQKYGRGLYTVAYNILHSPRDAEEIISDTLHKAWENIPPKRPEFLGAYLSKITRNLSLKRWKSITAEKRGGGQTDLLLSELTDAIPQPGTVESSFEHSQTVKAINEYLRGLDHDTRMVFVRRYFYGDSIQDICSRFNASSSKIKSMLHRARKKLKIHLEKEGVVI